jgi:hypothetical protein
LLRIDEKELLGPTSCQDTGIKKGVTAKTTRQPNKKKLPFLLFCSFIPILYKSYFSTFDTCICIEKETVVNRYRERAQGLHQ